MIQWNWTRRSLDLKIWYIYEKSLKNNQTGLRDVQGYGWVQLISSKRCSLIIMLFIFWMILFPYNIVRKSFCSIEILKGCLERFRDRTSAWHQSVLGGWSGGIFFFCRLARLVFLFDYVMSIENDKGNLKLNWPFPLSMRKLVDFLSPTEWGSKTVLASGNWWVFGF